MSNTVTPLHEPVIVFPESLEPRPPLNENWQARREFADALRRMNTAALTADVPTAQLRAATALLNAEATRFESNPRVFGRVALSNLASPQPPVTDLCFETSPADGLSNAVSPGMHVWREGNCLHGRVTLDWSYEGPSMYLHGGVIGLLFDDLLSLTQLLAGSKGRTGTLTIRYHAPTPINTPLHMTGRIDRVEGRKRFITGEIRVGETLTASCEGIFISNKQDESTNTGGIGATPAPQAD